MNCYNYTKNKADCRDIETHMRQCSGLFNPPLASYVNIYDYAKKIRSHAVTFEAWKNDELIGLVACYLNNYETLDGYVTNISTLQEHQGKGIASILLNKAIEVALDENFKTLSLEVEVENKKAIDLYRKAGFVLNGRRGNKYLMINRLLENKDVLVSICCVTYNHVKYIRNAIEGFLIQKVNFSIEILIHDDASDDGTSDIIREYERNFPEIIKPIYQTENQYSQGRSISSVYQFPRARGKYIALCEGDDYWIDSLKLQKQVDYLEENLNASMVTTYFVIKDEFSQQRRKVKIIQNINYEKLLIKKNVIATLTTCIRSKYIFNYINEINYINYKWPVGDYPLWLYLSLNGEIGIINDYTAVYLRRNNSACHFTDRKKQYNFYFQVINIASYYSLRYGASTKAKRSIVKNKINTLFNYGYSIRNSDIMCKWIVYYMKKYHTLPVKNIGKLILTYLRINIQ